MSHSNAACTHQRGVLPALGSVSLKLNTALWILDVSLSSCPLRPDESLSKGRQTGGICLSKTGEANQGWNIGYSSINKYIQNGGKLSQFLTNEGEGKGGQNMGAK